MAVRSGGVPTGILTSLTSCQTEIITHGFMVAVDHEMIDVAAYILEGLKVVVIFASIACGVGIWSETSSLISTGHGSCWRFRWNTIPRSAGFMS